MKAYRPVVILTADRITQGLALRVALNAGVRCPNEIEPCWIHDIRAAWIRRMFTSRAVAAFAADIPFGYGFGFDVVIDRVTAVAQRSRWTL